FSIDRREFIVSPNSNYIMYVTFSPESIATYQDTLKVTNNDPDIPIVQVPLTGAGRKLKDQKIAVFPDSLNFVSTGIGLTSSQNIQIRNEGEVNLVIDSIKINGSYFTIGGDTSFNINPGFSNWVSVLFQPDSIGKFETILLVYSNDPDTSEYRIPIIGYGRELLDPNITFYPDRVDFGDVAIGRSKSLNLYIGNDGEKALVINSIISSNDQFKVDKTSFLVQPGSSQILTVSFQPNIKDTIIAQFTVVNNDPDSSMSIVPLNGIGRALMEPQLIYSPTELNFGEVLLGDSLSQNITIQNTGDLALQLHNIVSHDSHFVVQVDSALIESGQSFNLKVIFSPSNTLVTQSTLEIKSNDPNNYVIYIPLQGKGKASVQQIVVSPTFLDFKDIRINSTSTQYLWVSNFDETPLTVTHVFSDNIHFKPQLINFTVEQNENRPVPVSFSPDSLKTFSGKLIIVSNDPVVDSLVVPLTGVGRDSLDQQIAVSPDSLNFGQVTLNNTTTLNITLNNIGEKNLIIYNIVSSNSVFTTGLTSLQIAPKSWHTLPISFTPTFLTTYNDTLKIISNDPNHDTLLVRLVGIGREPVPQYIVVSDTALYFGIVPTDRIKSLRFWIRNDGEKNLEVSQIAISDSQFSVNEQWLIIKPGETRNLTVTFSPRRSGSVNATLTVKNNDPKNSEVELGLNGRGVIYHGPKISIRPNSLHFGNTLIGAIKKLSLWVSNSSKDSTLKIHSFSFVHEAFAISQSQLTIPPEDSGVVQIVFKPYTVGNQSIQITIHSNDEYQSTLNFWVDGSGVKENAGQNFLADLGWKENGYAPFGQYFSPDPHTDDVLSSAEDRAWFIKDINLNENPSAALINLCFDDSIHLFINGTTVLTDTSSQPLHWNIANLNVKSYLKLGRNRIAALVFNKKHQLGGFDCELIISGVAKIKRGDQNWTHSDATWWYFGQNRLLYPTPPFDTPYDRLWFHSEYGLAGTDTISANWTFEPSGNDTLYDSTPYGQKAILHNITWIRGVIGQAMQFGGNSNSYVELYANLNSVPQTIELWFNCYEQRQYEQNIITNKGTSQFGQGLFIDLNMRLGV
ncbi:MAG: choice-of-anchor D domain-containing protein, partial [bacterium]